MFLVEFGARILQKAINVLKFASLIDNNRICLESCGIEALQQYLAGWGALGVRE